MEAEEGAGEEEEAVEEVVTQVLCSCYMHLSSADPSECYLAAVNKLPCLRYSASTVLCDLLCHMNSIDDS